MKKFFISLTAIAMMSLGLVAASEVTATAAPYPGSVRTSTSAVGVGPLKGRAKVFVRVISPSGKPKGSLNFTFVNRKSGKTFSFNRSYNGSPHTYSFGSMPKGVYTVLVTFVPPDGSKWRASTSRTRVRVR